MPVCYSLHQIDNHTNFSFAPADYSLFKFGDEAIAKKFGIALADGFINEHKEALLRNRQIVVIPSPYSFIPTATSAMKTWFVYSINRWLVANYQKAVQETKVHRTITYKEDYGELDAQQRIDLIGNDAFHIDKVFLEDKLLVFLDDIKITGSHERMIVKMIREYDLENEVFLLYFAELVNKDIHPNIENYLNYQKVKSIFDLEPIIKGGNFAINTRIVKYILNCEFESFSIFIKNQTDDFIDLLYDMALGNAYNEIQAYTANLDFINAYCLKGNNKKIHYGN